MKKKIAQLIGSIRFWQITGSALALIGAHYLPDMEFLFTTIAAWLATVAGIGTLDAVAMRFSGVEK